MPDIRYVCLSDMHLGADNSVLTTIKPGSIETDPVDTSPVLSQFVACLRELIIHNEGAEKPKLILNGDILEMALTDTNKAAMVFERFIELVFPPDGEALFNKNILYIPGNHDHHIWEGARETEYVENICSIPTANQLPSPPHTTKMFGSDLVREHFLTNLLRRYPHLQDAQINVVYPNYALANGQKCIILSHGHYVESIYSLMTTLNTMFFPNRTRPKVIWELESENFAWLDFFWSTLGRSGNVGEDIGLLYAKLQDPTQFDQLIDNFSTSFVMKDGRPKWVEGIEAPALKWLLNFALNRMHNLERNRPEQALSVDALQGLHSYMEGPLFAQIRLENGQNIPTDITFLFGHTHKPFQQEMNFSGYPAPINVYNSGGWVVDKVHPLPIFGAAALLLDETLQTISLHMYHQASNVADYAVRVEESVSAGHSPFYNRISALVKQSSDPWKTFSEMVAEAVGVHAQVLQTKINL